MNLVGKIFTVLIFVMSLVFMSLTVAVYATHKNWREVVVNREPAPGKPKGLQWLLEDVRTRNEELKAQKVRLEETLAKEKRAYEQVRAQLEQEVALLERQYKSLQEEQVKLVEAERKFAALVKLTEDRCNKLDEVIKGPDGQSGLRGDIKTAHLERDAAFKKALQLEDDLHQAVNELKRLRARQNAISTDLAKAEAVLRYHDLNKDMELGPPDVNGTVRAVRGQGTNVMIEVGIGTDDGVQKKHQLFVFRADRKTFVGRIQVIEAFPDSAVCTIIPRTQQVPLREGDYVTSRLR